MIVCVCQYITIRWQVHPQLATVLHDVAGTQHQLQSCIPTPVIRTVVETFTSHTIGCVPSATKARYFVLESQELSLIQLRSNLVSQTGATLHSDGTTKFGTKFMEAQVARDKKVYTDSLGLASVPSGSAQHSFDSICYRTLTMLVQETA